MQSVQSYNTAIARKKASAPLRFLEKEGLINGSVLDYGCGKGADYTHLVQGGYSAESYDPHWRPISLSDLKFDTILCTYVLNVVTKDSEEEILGSISSLLKKGGQAYISVRRDLKREGPTSRGFQRHVSLNAEVVKENSSFCIYRFKA